jgi:2-hydroxy-3-oxopropionate reductase
MSETKMGKTPIIGVIGLGNMGSRIAANIIADGYSVNAYDLSEEAMEHISSLGATPCKSSYEVADRSDVIMTVLPTSSAVSRAIFGSDGIKSAVQGKKGKKILLEMSSTDAKIIQKVSLELNGENCGVLSVTIHGVDFEVEKREIVFDVSGDKKLLDSVSPILAKLSRAIVYVGEDPSAAKEMKTCMAMFNAVNILATAEVLSWLIKKGLNPDYFVKLLESTPSHAGMAIGTKRMIKGGFRKRTSWMSKDIGFGLKEAEDMEISMPLVSAAQQVFLVGKSRGFHQFETRGMACKTYSVLTGTQISKED